MVSLTVAPNHLSLPPRFVGILNFPVNSSSLVLVINRRRRRQQPAVCFNLVAAKEKGSLRFEDFKRRQQESSWCCWCKGLESEGESALEAEILQFMTNSEKPNVFPTKKELVDAGRVDLAEAIAKKGGWLALGWDFDENSDQENVHVDDIHIPMPIDCFNDDVGDTQQRVGSSPEINSLEGPEIGSPGFSSISTNSSQSASSSGRSLEFGAEEGTGIEGILSRLEKQRNLSFGIDLGKKAGDERVFKTSTDADSADLERRRRPTSGSPNKDICSDFGGKIDHNRTVSDFDGSRNSLEPETWRSWSIQWAGSSDTEEFEATDISFNENQMREKKDALDGRKEVNHSEIRTRLHHLELELSSALCLLRSKNEESISKEGNESFSDDLRELSDAWEFQENEFMNAQDRLRSIRAKLAVLEGKMALAVIDAQKMAEEKQKRIDGARRALQLLHTACIVWPNTASEVLLAGSFDGWTTQRKMEKSSTGIFSVSLKLYPGKYEIKFVVDGIWRIDPLRPIVHSNGHQNNLLIIT